MWGVEGRGNLESWYKLGYIFWDDIDINGIGLMFCFIFCGVEYVYDDFVIFFFVFGFGYDVDVKKYY